LADKELKFYYEGNLSFTLTSSDFWNFKCSGKRMTGTSDFTLVPQRISLTTPYDSTIAPILLIGNEYSRNISKYVIHYYDNNSKIGEFYVDTSQTTYDKRNGLVDISAYDTMWLLKQFSDLTYSDSLIQPGKELATFLSEYIDEIESEMNNDITINPIIDAEKNARITGNYINLFYANLEENMQNEGIETSGAGISLTKNYAVIPDTNPLDWISFLAWGEATETYNNDDVSIDFYIIHYRVYANMQWEKIKSDKYHLDRTQVDSGDYESFFNMIDNAIYYGYTGQYTGIDRDTLIYNWSDSKRAYAYDTNTNYLAYSGEIYPDRFIVIDYRDEFPYYSARNSGNKYFDVIKAGLILYNYYLYADSGGNIHIQNKNVSNIGGAIPSAITISEDDIFNFKSYKITKEEVPLTKLNILTGETDILKEEVASDYALYFSDKEGVSCQIYGIETYDLDILSVISLYSVSYRIISIKKDYDQNEYDIKVIRI